MDKVNTNQISNTLADQKVKYEDKKEQERKRRFAILSGNIKPIQISFHLKAGEHAYFQIKADRMADRDYVESHTTGDARSPFIQGGLLRGNTSISTETRQERITKTEIIDSGELLLSNIRMLFIGKEVISIPYDDILSVEFFPNPRFDTTTISVKYPTMIKNECYDLEKKNDAKLYYEGIMRLIGWDKSNITEADVNMVDYPAFGQDEMKKGKKLHPVVRNILIGAGIFVVLSAFLRPFIIPINFILFVLILFTGLGYLGGKKKNTIKQQATTKKVFFWSLAILLLGLIVAASS